MSDNSHAVAVHWLHAAQAPVRPRHCTQALLQIDSYSLLCRALCAESAAERPSPASAPPFASARQHEPSATAVDSRGHIGHLGPEMRAGIRQMPRDVA